MKKSKRVISEVTKKSKRVISEMTKKRNRTKSAAKKKAVWERAGGGKTRDTAFPFLTGGWSFCMIKKNTFPAGASRINRQKIGAA